MEKHKANLKKAWVEHIDGGECHLKEYEALCGKGFIPGKMELRHDNDEVNCRDCLKLLPPPFLPADANQRLTGMSVNDRTVLRDWFSSNPHYDELVNYIDSLNADTMRRYGAKE